MTTVSQPNEGNAERDRADDFGLSEQRDERCREVEPRRVRLLQEIQDRAIGASQRAERDHDREDHERTERRGAAR